MVKSYRTEELVAIEPPTDIGLPLWRDA